MKQDIADRADIVQLLRHFYDAATADPVIGFFFTEVVPLNMHAHIPVIADFWEAVVFGKAGYRNDVLAIHRGIHAKASIRKTHLDHWVTLFTGTVDRFYEGPNAERMKQRAISIATMMDIKLNHGGIGTGG